MPQPYSHVMGLMSLSLLNLICMQQIHVILAFVILILLE
jgi:hypothetical protein